MRYFGAEIHDSVGGKETWEANTSIYKMRDGRTDSRVHKAFFL
jgi:hypothetical protein